MHSMSRTFVGSAESVPAARRYVAEALAGIPAEITQTAALLVSELATNAVLYSNGSFEVAVSHVPATGLVRVGVSDAGDGWPALQDPDSFVEHGRGLKLVAALSTRWGVQAVSTVMNKTVWFELGPTSVKPVGRYC